MNAHEPACLFCRKLAALSEVSAEELVWEFAHSVAFLGSWQYYHGYCVLVARHHNSELFQLEESERHAFLDEMCLLAQVLSDVFRPLKLNYELLGNQVPHLHWHLFPRYADDPDRLRPAWVALDRAERDASERHRLQAGPMDRLDTIARIRQQLQRVRGP
jgi:diadenosine tetraphosphate (Ap4A) HIT family hydrolase